MSAAFSADDLRLVLAIAEARGLSAAAARLGVDASTVFRRLGALEARLGVALFERHRTGYVATATGEEMAALAARIDEDVTAMALRIAGRDAAPEGEVRVATNDALLLNLLTPIFACFRVRHPAIRLDILTGNEALNLARRDADIAIRATASPPETLVGRRVATLGWALYGKAGTVAPGADLATLAESEWVSLGDGLEDVAAARFVHRHASPGRIVYKVNTVAGLADAVEAGIGIGPLPCYFGDPRPGLVRLAPPDPQLAGSLWLLTHPDLRHVPRVRLLLDDLAQAIGTERRRLEG